MTESRGHQRCSTDRAAGGGRVTREHTPELTLAFSLALAPGQLPAAS
jgi:hypothetical protein